MGLAAAGCSLVGTPKAPPGPAPTVAGAPGGTDAREGSERAEGGPRTVDLDAIPDAVPRIEPLSRYGNPPSYEVFGKTYHTLRDARGFVQEGMASWYGQEFHGRRTSSGEPYDMFAMTAAHRELPLPTYVRVTNLENGRSVVVRVNDRGPFHDTESRIIDLSYAAAYKLRIIGPGTARVRVEAIVP
ncbi:MAG: septal ring lytic transglycosylase RlpA family protein [Gemmatimonadetes bacterium]|nr:MAG: septal ring lytic transglycosylase RlpA family protein [Gemmatimonadota bacterium]